MKGLRMGRSAAAKIVDRTLRQAGERIRQVRIQRGMTLVELGRSVGLTPSMLSMVERGVANPSVGTLFAVTSVLGVSMGNLFDGGAIVSTSPVVRRADQPVVTTNKGVQRRILMRDNTLEVEFAENTYEPDTSSAEVPIKHRGHEFGIILSGELEVRVGKEVVRLQAGDAIHFDSSRPHRFVNTGTKVTRTIWVNLHGRRLR